MSTPIDVNWDSEFSYRGCGSGGGGSSGEGGADIDDSAVSGSTTWSSAKITDEQQALEDRLTEVIEAIDTECHVIDDSTSSEATAYSSSKVESLIDAIPNPIDDSTPSEATAYSSSKVESLIDAIPNPIDDSAPSEATAYSSAKVESLIEALPNPIDDSIATDDKTWSSEKITSEIDQKIDDSTTDTGKTWSSARIDWVIDQKLAGFETPTDDRKIYGFIERESVLQPENRIAYTDSNTNYAPMVMPSTGEVSYGSWDTFPFLLANKPYMVHDDGTADYELDPSDYTKRLDGTASDVDNLDYEGGAFSWIPKIYKKEWKSGNDRHVQFSMFKHPGFEAIGFMDENQNELPGVWIPMFYGYIDATGKMRSISGTQPSSAKNVTAEKNAIDNVGHRARFFGGALINTLTDLVTMFAKTSNCQVLGRGNQTGKDDSLVDTRGVLANAVVGGGQFYGTQDGISLNKLFHSVVLGSYQQWQRDPYIVGVNGTLKVSPYYKYDSTGDTYIDTGCTAVAETAAWRGASSTIVVPNWGALPSEPYTTAIAMGNCDGVFLPTAYTGYKCIVRFGACNNGSTGGLRAMIMAYEGSVIGWNIGASVLLLPPVT